MLPSTAPSPRTLGLSDLKLNLDRIRSRLLEPCRILYNGTGLEFFNASIGSDSSNSIDSETVIVSFQPSVAWNHDDILPNRSSVVILPLWGTQRWHPKLLRRGHFVQATSRSSPGLQLAIFNNHTENEGLDQCAYFLYESEYDMPGTEVHQFLLRVLFTSSWISRVSLSLGIHSLCWAFAPQSSVSCQFADA